MLFPVLVDYPEEKFGGFLAVTDYRSPFVQDEIEANGWIVWPPIRYSYRTINSEIPEPAPAHPSWMLDKETRCSRYAEGVDDKNCTIWNWNWLGTDDQARDVLARLIYGFRLSVLFGFTLTIISSIIGVAGRRGAGLFRRLRRPLLPALHRDLDGDPVALSAAHHLLGAGAGLLRAARHPAPLLLGGAGRPGARGVPARRAISDT